MGYLLKPQEALIIVYGGELGRCLANGVVTPDRAFPNSGLRGAVGLALALMAAGSLDKEDSQPILFITSGIVVLTMVINGTT